MNRFIFISGLIVLVFLISLSWAGIPKLINYQGMLTDGSGNPITDTLNLELKIYNAETNGDLKWSETQTDVPIIDGLFNVILGSVNPIDTLSFNEQYWLDITVDGEQMPNRLKFTSVAYAYRAGNCDTALFASRHIVHFPHLNGIYTTSVPGLTWGTIDKSSIALDLSQYGGPVRVAITFCGNDHTQLRIFNQNTEEGLDSTIVTGQNLSSGEPHIVVTGAFASVSENSSLALQWRATTYGYTRRVYEVSIIIEKLP